MSTTTIERIIETDLQQHIEDDVKVAAIRDNRLVEVYWSQLSEDEKRAAYTNMFLASGLY